MIILCFVCIVPLLDGAILGEWNDPDRDSYMPDSGHACEENQPSVKWYVDNYREKIYPFLHLGCGEVEENVFDDVPTAEQNLPKDSAQCVGFNMTGWPEYGSTEQDHKCPAGSSYLPYGEYSAICCDIETAAKYEESLLVTCAYGELPLTHEVIYMDDEIEDTELRRENRTLLGKSCRDQFCPEMYQCIQGEFEAHCCTAPTTITTITTTLTVTVVSTTATQLEVQHTVSSSLVGNLQNARLWAISAVAMTLVVFVLIFIVCKCRKRTAEKYEHSKETASLNP